MREGEEMSPSLERYERLRRELEMSKASRRVRTQRNFSRLLRRNEKKLIPFVRRYLALMSDRLRSGLAAAARTRKPGTFVKALADWMELEEEGVQILKRPLFKILEEGGKAVLERRIIKQAESFDPITTASMSWAEDHTAELVTLITAETADAIKAFVKDALERGESIQKIAKEIKPLVGLTEPHMLAVGRRMTELIEEGFPAGRVMELTERYANKLHRYRAAMISRTETAFALNEGVVEGYEQMGVKRLEWVADSECCDYCDEQNGKTFPIDEAHGLQPAHPNCECTWTAT